MGIVPAVYGKNMFKYDLSNRNALPNTIMRVMNYKKLYSDKVLSIESKLRRN